MIIFARIVQTVCQHDIIKVDLFSIKGALNNCSFKTEKEDIQTEDLFLKSIKHMKHHLFDFIV